MLTCENVPSTSGSLSWSAVSTSTSGMPAAFADATAGLNCDGDAPTVMMPSTFCDTAWLITRDHSVTLPFPSTVVVVQPTAVAAAAAPLAMFATNGTALVDVRISTDLPLSLPMSKEGFGVK